MISGVWVSFFLKVPPAILSVSVPCGVGKVGYPLDSKEGGPGIKLFFFFFFRS